MELENIEKQLFEIEILKSIYSNSNEFHIEDEEAVLDAEAFLLNPKDKSLLRRRLGFVIKFNADVAQEKNKTKKNDENDNEEEDAEDRFYQLPLEIICRLPNLYPSQTHPEVFVRCLKRNLSRNFPQELTNYVVSAHENDCSILNIIDWVKDNINRFLNNESNSSSKNPNGNGTVSNTKEPHNKVINTSLKKALSRMFIYSHHIYSVNKRKDILQWAKDLELNGFSMPGKPGMICIEGDQINVQEYWARLKTVPWQRLQVKETQTFELDEERKFANFEEKIFSVNNDSNIDLGLLFAYLKEKNLAFIFNLYFGVDGKLPTN